MYRFGILIAIFCALVESLPQIPENLVDVASASFADDQNSQDSNHVPSLCVGGEPNKLSARDISTDRVFVDEGSAENSEDDSVQGKPTQRDWMREV